MLVERRWNTEALVMLLAWLLAGWGIVGLFGALALKFLPAKLGMDEHWLNFLFGSPLVHAVALAAAAVFLRKHELSWREFLGFHSPDLGRALQVGLIVGLLVLIPGAWLLNWVSALTLQFFHVEPAVQPAVKILQESAGPGQLTAIGVAAVINAPLVEEIFFRGILYPALKQWTSARHAMVITSVLFALIHVHLATFLPLLFVSGVLIWLYEKTGTLLAAILAHSLFNLVNFVLLIYQPDLARLGK